MRNRILAYCLIAIYIAVTFALVGCETVYNDDGGKTTRFDASAFSTGVDTVVKGYQSYDEIRRRQQGYQQPAATYPFPVYAPAGY